MSSDGVPGNRFGMSGGIAGHTLVAHAPSVNVGGNSSQGAADVFVRRR